MKTLPELLKIYNNEHPEKCFLWGKPAEIGCHIVIYSDGSGKLIAGKDTSDIVDFSSYPELLEILSN